jgi:hypothetical protein
MERRIKDRLSRRRRSRRTKRGTERITGVEDRQKVGDGRKTKKKEEGRRRSDLSGQ